MVVVEGYGQAGKKMKVAGHHLPFGKGVVGTAAATGQPVLVPGSMGTASWVLVATEKSMELSLGSCCHGAGRTMSRSRAKRTIRGSELLRELKGRGIAVRAGSMAGLAEEAPTVYKDVDAVVEAVVGAGIARKVARVAFEVFALGKLQRIDEDADDDPVGGEQLTVDDVDGTTYLVEGDIVRHGKF